MLYHLGKRAGNGVVRLIRFKVIRASRLLMGLVIFLLVIILAVMITRLVMVDGGTPASQNYSDTNIVQNGGEEVVAAFAAASSLPLEANALFTDGAEPRHEDEHLDEIAQPMVIEKIPYESVPQEGTPLLAPIEEEQAEKAAKPAEKTEKPSEETAPKRVLIYHTHTHESYQQDPNDPYVQLEPWRTDDQQHSIVRVGKELAKLLQDKGLEVVHDVTDHEPPKLGTAYVRSLETLNTYKDQAFDCYLDLHRDAYIEGQGSAKITLASDGKSCAQLMMLIGDGDGYDEKPFYTENIAFARQLTLALNHVSKGICKEVLVKKNRYNQHIGKRAIIIEVGNNMNTLKEALNAMPTLAQALTEVLHGDVFLPDASPSPEIVPVNAAG